VVRVTTVPGGVHGFVGGEFVRSDYRRAYFACGIDDDINTSGRYDSVKSRGRTRDRATQRNDILRALSVPDFIVGSVAAVTETVASRSTACRWRTSAPLTPTGWAAP
jgi:hypothetical protein